MDELESVGTVHEMVAAAGRRWLRAVEDAKGVVEEAGISWGKFWRFIQRAGFPDLSMRDVWQSSSYVQGLANGAGINIDDIPWDELVPVLQELFANCPTE